MLSATQNMQVDVVDSDNRVVGRSPRSGVLENGFGFRTVHVFMFDELGSLLLQVLKSDHSRNPSRFGSSVAGYLHTGESYLAAAVRKTHDELGIDSPLYPVGQLKMRDERSNKFVMLYSANIGFREVHWNPDEMAGIAKLSLAEIDFMMVSDRARFTPTFVQAYGFFRSKRRPGFGG